MMKKCNGLLVVQVRLSIKGFRNPSLRVDTFQKLDVLRHGTSIPDVFPRGVGRASLKLDLLTKNQIVMTLLPVQKDKQLKTEII